jgi:hypothetical protein
MTKEFYVHTEDLKAVATQIQSLLDKINSSDASKGTIHDFQNARSIEAPTSTFWDGANAFSQAYDHEFGYVNDTYKKLTEQLTAVMNACTTTAAKYSTHETNAKSDVTSSSTQFGE